MAFTQFTNLDFDLVKVTIKDYLRSNSNFTDFDFEGSNLSVLIDILAYNTYIAAYNANMVANESFLDSATIRENVVSLARNIGYVPQSRRSSRARISFFISDIPNTVTTVTLKTGIVCVGNSDNTSYIFSTPEDITVGVENGTALFEDIEVVEGSLLTKSFTVDTSLVNQKYILPNSYIDTSTIRVKVKSVNATESEEFKYIDNIININSKSAVFLLQEISDERYEVFFGDDLFGKKLTHNDQVSVTYITSNGERGNGVSNFSFSGIVLGNNNSNLSSKVSSIVTLEPSTNGSEIQSIDSIRYYSPRLYASQYRAVTASDYEALLPSVYPNVESVTAYGGEEIYPPEYGTVFLAIKPKNADYLTEFSKESILTSLKKYSVAGINLKIVDINVLYVELESTVYYNSNLIDSPSNLRTKVIDSLNSYANSTDLNKFGGRFKYSKTLSIIDTTSDSITSNITRVKIRRNLGVLNLPTNYLICFENRFNVNSSGYNIRTTGFKVSGNPNLVYISDIPNEDLTVGKLFLFSLDGNEVKVEVNNVGSVDYITGEINIDNITVVSTTIPNNIIEIEAIPYSNDVISKKSVYLKLDTGKSKINLERDIISSGENSSGSRFLPQSSYKTDLKVRI
jgi:hypothetical protein